MVEGWFDGLCEWHAGKRNPGGCACAGWVIARYEHGGVVHPAQRGHSVVAVGDGATNNVAEYHAALEALRAIYRAGWRGPVLLRGDSQLVVRQYSGEYSVNAPLLIPLWQQLKKAASYFASVQLVWIPREQNEAADAESRAAYEAYRAAHLRTPAGTRR